MIRSSRPRWREVILGYLVLPHAVPIIVVISATASFALIAARGWPGTAEMSWLLLAMFGGQLAVGAVNELVDADLDARTKPSKPIPAGLVSMRGAWTVTVAGLALMTFASLQFDLPVFIVCTLGTGTGIGYSLWFKRTIWSWVPYLIALPLLPIWVWLALSEVDPGLFAIYPIGAAAVVAVQIAQSLPDVRSDAEGNVRTFAVALGEDRARWLCWGAMCFAAGLAIMLAPRLTSSPRYVAGATIVSLVLVTINAVIWYRNPRTGALASFPCIALGAVALGIGWTMALIAA